jgi:acyl-CoA thioester hydrolase
LGTANTRVLLPTRLPGEVLFNKQNLKSPVSLDFPSLFRVFYPFMKSPLHEFSIPVTVEFEDVDSYKIAHHTKLVSYLERARVRYFSSLGFALSAADMTVVLYHLEMSFKKPAFFQDELTVTVSLKSFDNFRMVLYYKIRRNKDLIARASTGLCFVDPVTKSMIPAPDKYVEKINALLPTP